MNALQQAVSEHLQNYFDQLDGCRPAHNLHKTIVELIEKPLIEECLDQTNGNIKKASEILGINRNTLRKKMHALSIEPDAKSSRFSGFGKQIKSRKAA